MKAVVPWLGAVLFSALVASLAQADPSYGCVRQAPDCCGPGFYCPNQYGAYYGPCYYLQPPWPPVGTLPPGAVGCPGSGPGNGAPGMMPGGCGQMPGGPGTIAAFPSHPFARGPRDFFMED